MSNNYSIPTEMFITINSHPNGNNETFRDYGYPVVIVPAGYYSDWVTAGSLGTNIIGNGVNTFTILSDSATIEGVTFPADTVIDMGIKFVYTSTPPADSTFIVDIRQWVDDAGVSGAIDTLLTGQRYIISPVTCPDQVTCLPPNIHVDQHCQAEPAVDDPQPGVLYEWYDAQGTFIQASNSIVVSPTITSFYYVYAYQNGCVNKDSCEVVVEPFECMAPKPSATGLSEEHEFLSSLRLLPNPASNLVTVYFDITLKTSEIVVTNLNGAVMMSAKVREFDTAINLDTRSLPNGLYYVTAWSTDHRAKTEKLIIIK
jgi:hypothetical protein